MNNKKPLILVVEDDPRQAENFATIINESGRFEAIVAHNGTEALDKLDENRRLLGFAQNKIRCILLDIRMPEMNGTQFIKLLRRSEKYKAWNRHIPVIFLTAFENEDYLRDANHAADGMAAGYIKKPLKDHSELINKLVRIVENNEAEIMIADTRDESYIRLSQMGAKDLDD